MPAWFTFLLVEAAQVTVRSDCDWRRQFFCPAMRRGRRVAEVAMAPARGSSVRDVAQGMGSQFGKDLAHKDF